MRILLYIFLVIVFSSNSLFSQNQKFLPINLISSESVIFIDSLNHLKYGENQERFQKENLIIMLAIDKASDDSLIFGLSELTCDYEFDFANPQFYIFLNNNLILLRFSNLKLKDLFERNTEFIRINEINCSSIQNQLINTSELIVKKGDINMVSVYTNNKLVSRELFTSTCLFPTKYREVYRLDL